MLGIKSLILTGIVVCFVACGSGGNPSTPPSQPPGISKTVALVYDQPKNQMALIPDSSREAGPFFANGNLSADDMKTKISPELQKAFPLGRVTLDFVGETQKDSLKVQVFHWRTYDLPRGGPQSGYSLMVFDDGAHIVETGVMGNQLAQQALRLMITDASLVQKLHKARFTLPGEGSIGFHKLLRSVDPSIDVSKFPDL